MDRYNYIHHSFKMMMMMYNCVKCLLKVSDSQHDVYKDEIEYIAFFCYDCINDNLL